MNPSSPTSKPGPTLRRDVAAPTSISAEIVNDIPVQPTSSPVAQVFKPSGAPPPSTEDKELDHILRDVNSSVKQSENSAEARFEHLSGVRKKVAVKKAKLDEAHHGSPPIVATIIACLVALMLTAAAFVVYRKGY